MSSSERASAYLHGLPMDFSNNPPKYNDVMKMSHLPTAPLLESRLEGASFSSIFGVATSVQFEHNSAAVDLSFFIRDSDGSLQARGGVTSHHTVVQSVDGMEMLKIIERAVDEVNGATVRMYSVIHKHAALGSVKVTENSTPRTSMQIFRGNGTPIVVNSLKIGDYAIFRNKSLDTPLCNIQMPGVEVSNPSEFNVKIIFHPQTGITAEEQLLCTAAAIAFKVTMKQKVEKVAKEDKCLGCICGIICIALFIGLMALFIVFLDKYACESKKAKGYAGYVNRNC